MYNSRSDAGAGTAMLLVHLVLLAGGYVELRDLYSVVTCQAAKASKLSSPPRDAVARRPERCLCLFALILRLRLTGGAGNVPTKGESRTTERDAH